jgi:hypothetical protein
MPLRSSSRTVSRRSRPVRRGLLTLAVLLALASALSAQTLDLRVDAAGGTVDTHLIFHWGQSAALIKSLESGLESRISFTIRLFETRRGWLPFRRDRLVAERIISRSAYLDRLDERYVVEQDGDRRSFATDADLLSGFLNVEDAPFSGALLSPGRALYVVAQARFEPVLLMPPLTLVRLVGVMASVASPWMRTDLP